MLVHRQVSFHAPLGSLCILFIPKSITCLTIDSLKGQPYIIPFLKYQLSFYKDTCIKEFYGQ